MSWKPPAENVEPGFATDRGGNKDPRWPASTIGNMLPARAPPEAAVTAPN